MRRVRNCVELFFSFAPFSSFSLGLVVWLCTATMGPFIEVIQKASTAAGETALAGGHHLSREIIYAAVVGAASSGCRAQLTGA